MDLLIEGKTVTVGEDQLKTFEEPLQYGFFFLQQKGDEAELLLPTNVAAIYDAGRTETPSRAQLLFNGEVVHRTADTDRTDREEEIIRCARSLAHIYGVYPERQLRSIWNLNHPRVIDMFEIIAALDRSGDEDGFFRHGHFIVSLELEENERYCDIMERCIPEDSYAYPRQNTLDEYLDGPVMNTSERYRFLRNFLAQRMGMQAPVTGPEPTLDALMEHLAMCARCDDHLVEVLAVLNAGGVTLRSPEDETGFINLYTGWLYGMRLWTCKGNMPEELPPGKMSLHNFRLPEGVAPVSNLQIGRNDLCLCGSGKKFKKCCAREIQE